MDLRPGLKRYTARRIMLNLLSADRGVEAISGTVEQVHADQIVLSNAIEVEANGDTHELVGEVGVMAQDVSRWQVI